MSQQQKDELVEVVGQLHILERKDRTPDSTHRYNQKYEEVEEQLEKEFGEYRAEEMMRYIDNGLFDQVYDILETGWS